MQHTVLSATEVMRHRISPICRWYTRASHHIARYRACVIHHTALRLCGVIVPDGASHAFGMTFSMRRFLVALISVTITSLLPWNGIEQPTKLEHLKPVEITELGPSKDKASGMECYNLNGPDIIMARGRAWNRKMLRQRKHVQDAE